MSFSDRPENSHKDGKKGQRRLSLFSRRLLILSAAVLLGLVFFFLWRRGAFLPRFVRWETKELTADLDLDGTEETVVLSGRRLFIRRNGTEITSTASDRFVSDAVIADLDPGGPPEILFLVWKRGSFGASRPFWIEKDDQGFSQHLFVYHLRDGRLAPVWMSSALGFSVERMFLDEELRLHLVTPQGSESVWRWDHWGFSEG